MAYLQANGIRKTFGKGDGAVQALRGVSLTADKGGSSLLLWEKAVPENLCL